MNITSVTDGTWHCRQHWCLTAPGALLQSWAYITACVEFHMFFHVHVDFLQVLLFPPNSPKHAVRWIDTWREYLWNVYNSAEPIVYQKPCHLFIYIYILCVFPFIFWSCTEHSVLYIRCNSQQDISYLHSWEGFHQCTVCFIDLIFRKQQNYWIPL